MTTKKLATLALAALALAASAQVFKQHIDRNGTYVESHRSRPNSIDLDNYGTRGSNNPYTRQEGTRTVLREPVPGSITPKSNTYGTDCGYTCR